MAAIDRLPTNKNFLSPLGFNFSIFKTPGVNFFVQSASIPSLNIGRAEINTPFNTLKYPGDKIDYGDMNITFRVDEELRNYYELYTWLTKITRNEGFTGYNSLVNANPGEGCSPTLPLPFSPVLRSLSHCASSRTYIHQPYLN